MDRTILIKPTIAAVMVLMMVSISLTSIIVVPVSGERTYEKKISWSGLRQWSPVVWGNRVTWEDDSEDIIQFAIEGNEEYTVTETLRARNPEIYGRKVVIQEHTNGFNNRDIYVVDLDTEGILPISTALADQINPSIWNDLVVWQEKVDTHQNVAYTWLSSGGDYGFTTWSEDNNQTNPDVCGRTIVYQDDTAGNWDIYYYDVYKRENVRVTSDTSTQGAPKIYDNKIVWTDYRNGPANPDIYMYDMVTKEERQITTNSSAQYSPRIYEDRIVWMDYRMGNCDIFMMDLNDGIEVQVTTNTYDQTNPDINGDVIVWEDTRPEVNLPTGYGSYDIYMTYIDQDNDGIYDWEDQAPLSDESDLEVLSGKMDALMVQLRLTEGNLTDRIEILREDLIERLEDHGEEIMEGISSSTRDILLDLEQNKEATGLINQSLHEKFTSLLDNITLGRNDVIKNAMDFLDAIEERKDEVQKDIEELMEEMQKGMEALMNMTDTIAKTNEELSTDMVRSMEQLEKLDGIVTDLETIGKDVKEGPEDDEEDLDLIGVLIIVLLIIVILLLIISMISRRKRNDLGFEE
ncbi:MAG: hypothetical protein MUC62_04020 [Candidatus Thermoplasmatota archaeon]|jgi:beta propeller repeat protein|nr:hypothetical protein [Candidatus Thermoplasmatota archaeon]